MPDYCTILCPTKDAKQALAAIREAAPEGAEITVQGKANDWSSVTIQFGDTSLLLNRLARRQPGDELSRLCLGLHNYFNRVRTRKAIKAEILDRAATLEMAIGVVAEPSFAEEAGHYDCIFEVAKELGAVIWNGTGVLDAEGRLLLDGDGNSEVK